MNTKLIEAVPVVRDEDGRFFHPDIPDFDEGQNDEWNAWIAVQGLEIARGMLEDEPDDHPAYVAYFGNDECSFAGWEDSPPAGNGWFTLAISDTEDGPVWCWARRIQPTQDEQSPRADRTEPWTDEQRANYRANQALVYRCVICCASSGEPHFPSCPEGKGDSET